MRDTDSEDITSYSVMVNNEGFSKGKHHWMAHKMNNSDQDSSKRVTWPQKWPQKIIFEFSGQNCIIPGPERVG